MNFDSEPNGESPLVYFAENAFDVSLSSVRLIQTHISWVLLAGKFAYKFKKPVAFPFLDYGSLEKRQQFCQKELERNRKWAGSLYIDIVGLHGDRGSVSLGEPTSDVEWGLRMHQFSQDDCLLAQADKGPIPSAWIDDLAEHFVAAHADAKWAAADSPWGTGASLSQQLDQCCLDVRAAANKMEETIDIESEDRLLQAKLQAVESRLTERRKLGFVRECHGDLHLGNLIRWQGHTVGFDAIEFNPDFYWIDVWNDVAFTIMDLDWRKQSASASRLINAYAEGSGDYGGLELLPLFTAYRALVRARIAALRILQESNKSDVARDSLQAMKSYLGLAEHYFSTKKPKLWITHGLSGSGKSKGIEPLIESQRVIRIRTDVERKRLAGIDRLQVGEAAIYSAAFTERTYRRCTELAAMLLDAGYSVVIDGTFLKRWQREWAYDIGNRMSVAVEVLSFNAPVEVLRERISSRMGDPSDATGEVLSRQIAEQEPLTADEQTRVRSLDILK
jgi:uncharacterized protein